MVKLNFILFVLKIRAELLAHLYSDAPNYALKVRTKGARLDILTVIFKGSELLNKCY
jgi:hypothetical protein